MPTSLLYEISIATQMITKVVEEVKGYYNLPSQAKA
jgi:hypothetical protein